MLKVQRKDILRALFAHLLQRIEDRNINAEASSLSRLGSTPILECPTATGSSAFPA